MVVFIGIIAGCFIIGGALLFYFNNCNHVYAQIYHFETPSEADTLQAYGMKPNTHTSLTRKYVTDYQCSKCHKLHRKIVKS